MTNRQKTPEPRAVVQLLESLEAAGVQQIAKPRRPATELGLTETPTATPADPPIAPQNDPAVDAPIGSSAPQTEALFGEEDRVDANISSAATLDILRDEVAGCTLCQELASTRTQTVFGVGNPEARLCFLGEAPGGDEDRQGEPFVGRAGQLLNKVLEACQLSREEVYILNVLKCRPPGNRNPAPGEVQNCRRFLDRQLQLIHPEFICCLGAVAAQNLLETTTAIGRLRGKLHNYRGMHVICTYHPAYLLRNPAAKRHTWDDMKLLMREMGTPVD